MKSRLIVALLLAGVGMPAQARISAEDRSTAEAFQAAVRGERAFDTDFMVDPPNDEERAYLMNLGSCKSGDLYERDDTEVRMVWSCNMDGVRFQKEVILQIEGGRIAKVGIFDCINAEGRRRCR